MENLLKFKVSTCQVPHKQYSALLNNAGGRESGVCVCHSSKNKSYSLQLDSEVQERHPINSKNPQQQNLVRRGYCKT